MHFLICPLSTASKRALADANGPWPQYKKSNVIHFAGFTVVWLILKPKGRGCNHVPCLRSMSEDRHRNCMRPMRSDVVLVTSARENQNSSPASFFHPGTQERMGPKVSMRSSLKGSNVGCTIKSRFSLQSNGRFVRGMAPFSTRGSTSSFSEPRGPTLYSMTSRFSGRTTVALAYLLGLGLLSSRYANASILFGGMSWTAEGPDR
mmetsp:Transcript_19491/g.37721  ORF Transcript_19491/g.37721 Transcript_19491/m.37721 type:complete len:205 (+) Transcript_19491:1639-2253(+)